MGKKTDSSKAVKPVETVEEVSTAGESVDSFEPVIEAYTPLTVVVTGELDGQTIRGLQFALSVKQSGALDAATIKALHNHLGLEPAAAWSRETRVALQAYLEVESTPTFDSRSVKALQRVLAGGNKW